MALTPPSLTIGVEEEYLLVDIETGDLAIDPPEELLDNCIKELGDCVSHEFLRGADRGRHKGLLVHGRST